VLLWNDAAQTDPQIDPFTGQQAFTEEDRCADPVTGLQWEEDFTTGQILYELYNTNRGRTINDNRWTGDITLAARQSNASLYFQRDVTDYDGCYTRVTSTPVAATQGYWDIQDDIDIQDQTIRTNIAAMCAADKCMYDAITDYLNEARQTKWQLTEPYPSWSTYLLDEDSYTRNESAKKLQEESAAAVMNNSLVTPYNTELET